MASNKVIEKKDITKLGLTSMFLQASFNYERMQAGGFLCAQLPLLKKIYNKPPPSFGLLCGPLRGRGLRESAKSNT